MTLLQTERLTIRLMTLDDAAFMLELLNQPSWLRFIGDRGVRTLEDAQAYIRNGPLAMYARLGFGFFIVELRSVPIGMCGLVKRDGLDAVDIGYAFLEDSWGKGYAYEAAAAVLRYGRDVLKLQRIVAITTSDNERSARLLEKIGLRFEGMLRLPDDTSDLRLFGIVFDNGYVRTAASIRHE